MAACDSDLTEKASFDEVSIEFNSELEKHTFEETIWIREYLNDPLRGE